MKDLIEATQDTLEVIQGVGSNGAKCGAPHFAPLLPNTQKRRIPGRKDSVTCVLLDSVQSQANRMELALQEAVDSGKIHMPVVVVDFSKQAPTGDVDADKAARRLIDAIEKITSLPFRRLETAIGL